MDLIYNYGIEENQNQVLVNSDRITINSKSDDIFLSSNKDIHMGTKRHLTISTNENFIINSQNTYLGNPFSKDTKMDNLVLGKKLQQVLKDIVSLFHEIKVLTQLGTQSTLPLPSEQKVISDIEAIISTKHFIEEK